MTQPLTYKDAGVDIAAGDSLVERIKPLASRTTRPECIGGLGGFGGLFELAKNKYREPVLVSGTDGVGTKLKLAIETGRHDGIGVDLVAMCVNDIIVCGAEPLFFLDYFAVSKLDPDHGAEVISGIAEGCVQAGAALLGGETAEMPGMYQQGDYDLAGFAVGVVEKDQIIDGSRVTAGDSLIALSSSGPHSNGYSLIRKIIEVSGASLDLPMGSSTLGAELMSPTRIYVKAILGLIHRFQINSIAHITGGGLPGNVVRVLPGNCRALIDTSSWNLPEVFRWLQQAGNVATDEMHRTFNCGIGLVIALPSEQADDAIRWLNDQRQPAWKLGCIEAGDREVVVE